MATLKHLGSKNADYGAAEQYLLFEHDEFTMKPVLDENGRLIPREDYRLSTLNCGGEDFAVACMRSNLRYEKNQRREDVKSHHYIISFDPRDGPDNGLTVDRAQALGEQFCKEHFPGHQALVCTHPDGHNHSGNIHVHIVINSLRIEEVPFLPYMDRPADTKAGCKHRCTDAALRYFKSEVMEMCHREGLYQIDLLNGSKNRVTDREYWAQKKGQAALDKQNAPMIAGGITPRQTKFETNKEKLRQTLRKALATAASFDEFSSLLLREGVTVKESRGRLSYLTPDRTKPITARKLGGDFDRTAVLAVLEQNAQRGVTVRYTPQHQAARAAEQTAAIPEYLHAGKGRLQGEKTGKIDPRQDSVQRLVDIEQKMAEGKGKGYERWAKIHNLKQAAKTLTIYQQYGFSSPEQLEAAVATAYQETDDQLRSIQEIKSDMEKPSPMDRLLCGDVGFGKTEVALRAAFKCMLDNKQVAILVPTTVLAWQHYQTAIKRFEHFPVKVELLSRFRKPKEQQQIIRELNRGTIDLIIGTHRLVQKDVKFKDLGLVIIDEEQRFGVAHKEKFKETFKGVDVLTLSATPIPRTLNMAMSGIRDMSVIEEPPMDRHPVQTYVIEHNMGVIAQAISKELRRGGQVYYIHNRVETIMMTANKLQEMLPDARIAFAHGQMPEEELSEIWRQLCDREIDILVCTTIIETGVDVPNVNTLIIEDADRLGLSQLYQLRGRVGRSNRRAFAYFTFRRGKVLTEVAAKRLDAIREFTQFGSGFRIALRDLEIRGAGSILSGKQHGHMEAVGYDMYLRLLNEAIAEQKGEALPPSPEDCLVDISIDAFIPDHYIENLSQRIDCYRKIASIGNEEDSRDVIDELIDRYGDPPKSVLGLVNVALTRNTASKLGIKEITQRGDKVLFFVKTAEVEQIQALYGAYKNRIRFFDGDKPYFAVTLEKKQKAAELMAETVRLMRNEK